MGLMEREEESSVKCILYYYLMVDLSILLFKGFPCLGSSFF